MSRLLFAAARGARVQTWVGALEWREEFRVAISNADQYWVRIHPDDEHLQYGPISTALREVALTGDCDDADTPYLLVEFEREDSYWGSTENQRCVFLLILAEALADSGL